jgi:hypothetical protein
MADTSNVTFHVYRRENGEKMKIKKTFTAKICLGLREGYTQKVHTLSEVYLVCHQFCNSVGLCVTVTPTRFIYTNGQGIKDGYEDGCFVELISYPRFPQSKYDIVATALDLTKVFMREYNQTRISIIASDQTYLVEQEDLK